MELDHDAKIISYEEYTPYGSTSYQAGRSQAEVKRKQYRYTGMERDEESGFSYHSARYYLPWLGRWATCDPKSLSDSPNLYSYTAGNPVVYLDPFGTDRYDVNTSFSYTDRKIAGDNYKVKAEYRFPQTLSLQGATDAPLSFLSLEFQGTAARVGNWRFSAGNRQLSLLHLDVSTSTELNVGWRPEPLVLDLSLRGISDLYLNAPDEWFRKQGIAGGKLTAKGTAKLHIDFGRLGNLRVSTPVDVGLRAWATNAGVQFKAGYGYGKWYARSDRTYEGVYTHSQKEGLHTRITKTTSTDKGLGFYERPASLVTSDSQPLSPLRKYRTNFRSQAEPQPPDAEGRLADKNEIRWQQYVGAGYRKSVTVVGKSRLEYSVSAGIGVNEQYLPNSFVISGVLKYQKY